MTHIRYIDLFAGMGGIRKGLEMSAERLGVKSECVLTSEIKPYAVSVLKQNHPNEEVKGDITKIRTEDIPDFDILLAGFPCQPFSAAGQRRGFNDSRGTMFFEVARILKDKMPKGFLLENVEGLVNHDGGKTLSVILGTLDELGYNVSYRVLNSKDFGIAQERKRIYIVGTLKSEYERVDINNFDIIRTNLESIIEKGKPTLKSKFIDNLLSKYSVEELYGKSIKDKRGGEDNIHSWDLETKGPVSEKQRQLLNAILHERRKKKWAEEIGIEWMDGMPLTKVQIESFYKEDNLQVMLDDLEKKGYLKLEHPKKKVYTETDGAVSSHREYDTTKEKGYNIVTGKLSFEINKILNPKEITPTLVAMDMQKLYVVDNGGLRRLTLREGLRLFGYPDDYKFDIKEKDAFDLLGNTVVVPVIKEVSERLLKTLCYGSSRESI